MALAFAIKRTIFSSSFLHSNVCGATYKCSFTCGNILSKKLSIAEELNLPEPPSKPQQPFVKFMSLGHKELTNLTWSERIQKLSAAWNNQTQEEKTRRLEEYYEEKEEYQQKYHQYLSQLSDEQLKSIKRVQERRKQSKETMLAKKEKKKELERLGKPKSPENCFIVFAGKLQRPDDMPWKEFLVFAASKWKELPECERNRYKDGSRARSEKYEAEMAEWEKKMFAMGRSELLRRRTYLVYQASDPEGHRKQTSRSNDDAIASSKLGQSITIVEQERVDCGQKSSPTQTGTWGKARERASPTVLIPDDCHSTSSSDTIILKNKPGVAKTHSTSSSDTIILKNKPGVAKTHSTSSSDTIILKNKPGVSKTHSTSSSDTIIAKSRAGAAKTHSTASSDTINSKSKAAAAKTRISGIKASLNQGMVNKKNFSDSLTEYSTNDSTLFRNFNSGTRGESSDTPQGYVTLGSRRSARHRDAMFAAAFPDD